MTNYKKGLIFGSIIGSIVSCLVTNFYIRQKYMLIPLDLTKYIPYMPPNKWDK